MKNVSFDVLDAGGGMSVCPLFDTSCCHGWCSCKHCSGRSRRHQRACEDASGRAGDEQGCGCFRARESSTARVNSCVTLLQVRGHPSAVFREDVMLAGTVRCDPRPVATLQAQSRWSWQRTRSIYGNFPCHGISPSFPPLVPVFTAIIIILRTVQAPLSSTDAVHVLAYRPTW